MKNKFFDKIKEAKIERTVEDVYNEGINLYFPTDKGIEYPFACDGFVDTKTDNDKVLKLIIEYKFNEMMSNTVSRAKVLTQVIYYIKKFEQNGMILPNVCMVGDKDECFVMHTNELLKYLDENVDWSISPSNAATANPDLVLKISQDTNINPFIFEIDENFNFKLVAEKIKDLAENIQRYVRVTEHNLSKIFDYFCKNVLKGKTKLSGHDMVEIFMGVIGDKMNYFQHPSNPNILVCKGRNVNMNGNAFKSFFGYFDRNYTPQETMCLNGIADRLIVDADRRNSGDFWTPTMFVDYAHDMISKKLGEDWKEKYVVWDNCYDKETEFLSQNGWKKISDYKESDLVMQFNQDGTSNFTKPIRHIKQEYLDDWVVLKGTQIDIKCTKDHNFVVFNDRKDRNQDFYKIPAIQLYNKSLLVKNLHLNIPKTFNYNGSLNVDENILRLAIAINADGNYSPKTTLNNHKNRTSRNTRFTDNDTSIRDCYVVSVKKNRKSERMHLLLKNANIEYKYKERGDYKIFTFHFPFNTKHFPKEWYDLSNESKSIIIDEIFNWDGCTRIGKFKNTRKYYSTSKKDDADFISFVFSSMGYGVYLREDKRGPNTNYILSPTTIRNAKISSPNNIFTIEKNNDGVCYCFEVPSGMLVVRRNGKIYISSNCCGSLNLTRDYKFGELYCSTLYQSELNIGADYNPEATKFQFDFLNDEIVSKNSLLGVYNDKLPKGLKDALINNKPIVFFINPPYASANVMGTNEKHKEGVAKTMINEQMLKDKIGASSQNLYAQFLYRIIQIKNEFNLTNCHIALFSPTLFLTGSSYAKFRNVFLNEFSFDNAIQFKASHFADVADNWGISFSIWHNGITENKNDFEYTLVDNINGEIIEQGKKVVYNIDGLKTASDWCKESIKGLKTEDAPQLSSAIKLKQDGQGKLVKDALGYYVNVSNNVYKNQTDVYIVSSCSSMAHGISILPDNFERVCANYVSRKLIVGNWVNSKDEYLAPNTEHPAYNEFVNDSLIYSLFHSSSNQSSLRNVDYKGKKWDIKNEFFWLSNKEIENLSNTNGFTQTYNDARTSKERYVYNKLQTITLSPEAQDVLDKASDIVRNTFKYRELFNQEHPEYQIMNWDCGWYQIKALAKEYAKSDYEEFVKLYKKLSDKMRPMVYTLGFLK